MKKTAFVILIAFALFAAFSGRAALAMDFSTPTLPANTPTLPPTMIPTEIPTELPTELPSDFPLEDMLELPSELDGVDFLAYAPATIDDIDPPDSFDSTVVNVLDLGITPVEYDFMFTDGQPAYCYYLYDVATTGGETVRVEREYLLTYCKQTCLSGEPVFITGSYSETSTGAVEGFMSGHVEGGFILFDESAPNPSLVGKTFIALTHIPDSFEGVQAPEQLVYTVVFLEPTDWFPGGTPTPQVSALPSNTQTATPRITPTPNSGGGLFASPEPTSSDHTDYPYSGGSEEDHHHSSGSSSSARSARHSSSSDMPETSGPVQVAVGTIFISIIAALSNLPTVTLGSGMGAFASSAGVSSSGSSAVSTSSQAQGAAQSTSSSASSSGGGSVSVGMEDVSKPSGGVSEILSAIGDFFKQLIANLRDMLTDEGRSYASGKVSDIFEDEQ